MDERWEAEKVSQRKAKQQQYWNEHPTEAALINSKEATLLMLNADVKKHEGEVEQLNNRKNVLESKITRVKGEIYDKQNNIEKQSRKIFGKTKVTDIIAQCKAEIQSLQADEQIISDEIAGINNEITIASGKLNAAKRDYSSVEYEM